MNSLQQIPLYLDEMSTEQLYDLLIQALLNCNSIQEIRILPNKAKFIVKNALKQSGLIAIQDNSTHSTGSGSNLQSLTTSMSSLSWENQPEDSTGTGSGMALGESIDYNIQDIIQLIQYFRLTSQNRLLQYFYEGLSMVLPIEILPIFTSEELEILICGENKIDLDVLKKATEYESVSPTDK